MNSMNDHRHADTQHSRAASKPAPQAMNLLRPRRIAAASFIWLAVASASPARASQYALEQAAAIIPRAVVPSLRRAGVRTTEDFLTWGKTPEGRRLLAQRARLSVDQVTGWVFLADLMRVRGIGPDVARLLTAAGIRSLADLQRADAGNTAQNVKAVNKKTRLSTNPPGAESLGYWIEQSRALPIIVLTE